MARGGALYSIRLQEYPVSDVGAEDVAVEMKVCAVNPADINGIQGKGSVGAFQNHAPSINLFPCIFSYLP